MVFAFPYRADIVDAVRARSPAARSTGRRKEWWAPRADATAAYVQGVLERFPELEVAPEVEEWLSRAVKGWVGRVTAARRDGAGWFVLDGDRRRAAGGARERRRAARRTGAGCRSPRRSPTTLLDLAGARLDPRALRCATRLQVGLTPAPATLSLVESYGEARFKLEVNWDPDTVGAFRELPAAEAHGRTLPIDPYLLEPLEHFIRVARDRRRRQRPRGARRGCGPSTTRRSAPSAARAPRTADRLECEDRLGGELRPFQRAGVAYALQSRRLFIADEQGLGKTVEALATLEEDDALPGRRHLPGVA